MSRQIKTVHLLAWGRTPAQGYDRYTADAVVRLTVRTTNAAASARLLDRNGEDAIAELEVVERVGSATIARGFGVRVNYTPAIPPGRASARVSRKFYG